MTQNKQSQPGEDGFNTEAPSLIQFLNTPTAENLIEHGGGVAIILSLCLFVWLLIQLVKVAQT